MTSQTSTADFQSRFVLAHLSCVSHSLRETQELAQMCLFSFELTKCTHTRVSQDGFPSFEATNLTKAKGQICPARTSSDIS